MINFSRNLNKINLINVERQVLCSYSTAPEGKKEVEFKPLNLKHVRGQGFVRRAPRKYPVLPPRTNQMPINQDWGSVWPGPRSFQPNTVPLPVRQGYVEKGSPPQKYANAELMKIPNFLHLTPPVIKRQCEALKQFCTPWPKELNNDEIIEKHFPIEVVSSDYCHSSPTIRDPMSRIVTIKFKLSSLNLNQRAKDKFLRLVGERYDEVKDTVTIVTDRCPLRKQNYDYVMYLFTALYHESNKIEPWEELKSELDMEVYDWHRNASKKNIEAMFAKKFEDIPKIQEYQDSVTNYMNEGENEYTISKYTEAVRNVLNLSPRKGSSNVESNVLE